MNLDLDRPAKFTAKDKEPMELSEEDIKNKTEKYYANNNKESYMKNFSQRYEIPSVYIIFSILYEPDSNYLLQLVKFVHPTEQKGDHDKIMVDHNGKHSTFKKVYDDLYGTYLRLVHVEHE